MWISYNELLYRYIGCVSVQGIRFVIRGKGDRAVKEGFGEINFNKIVNEMEFKYELPGLKANEVFHCATRRINVRTDDHPSKKSNT
ncbi:MAG: hypothetical protein ABFD01_05330, partial [Candidatus Cloacimonas sp.]